VMDQDFNQLLDIIELIMCVIVNCENKGDYI
jgi:hypothetical protein